MWNDRPWPKLRKDHYSIQLIIVGVVNRHGGQYTELMGLAIDSKEEPIFLWPFSTACRSLQLTVISESQDL